MGLTTLVLSGLFSIAPIQNDTTEIDLQTKKLELKTTEMQISFQESKTQYEIPFSKNNLSLFSQYDSIKNPNFKPKDIPYISTGIKIRF